MNIPKQYHAIMPYLIVKDAKAFQKFAETVFGAKEQLLVPRSENIIMHGELRIGDGVVMFADATGQFKERPAGMFVYIEKVDEVYQKAIAAGATSLMVPQKMDYGYTAGFEDSFGNQ